MKEAFSAYILTPEKTIIFGYIDGQHPDEYTFHVDMNKHPNLPPIVKATAVLVRQEELMEFLRHD